MLLSDKSLQHRDKRVSCLWAGPGLAVWGLIQSNTSIWLDWTEPYLRLGPSGLLESLVCEADKKRWFPVPAFLELGGSTVKPYLTVLPLAEICSNVTSWQPALLWRSNLGLGSRNNFSVTGRYPSIVATVQQDLDSPWLIYLFILQCMIGLTICVATFGKIIRVISSNITINALMVKGSDFITVNNVWTAGPLYFTSLKTNAVLRCTVLPKFAFGKNHKLAIPCW